MDGADIQGKFSMVKHSQLAKIRKNHKSFPPPYTVTNMDVQVHGGF